MKVEKNTATKPARVSPKMSSTNRFHSTAAKLPDRRSFPQLRTDVDTQGEKHHWSLHRSFIDPSLIPSSILHRPFISPRPPFIDPSSTLHRSLHRPFIDPRPPPDHPQTAPNIHFSIGKSTKNEKCWFFIGKVYIWSPRTAPRPAKDQDKTAHWKSIIFSSKILVFHWKNVGLEPTGAFYITF